MILKTYSRVFTTDLDATLRTLRVVHDREPHLSFEYGDWKLVAIGDTLIVAGTNEALAPIRGSYGPWIVEDIEQSRARLIETGAEIIQEIANVPTGKMMYARHSDGIVVEYVQWAPELVERHILAPLRAGRLSSQI